MQTDTIDFSNPNHNNIVVVPPGHVNAGTWRELQVDEIVQIGDAAIIMRGEEYENRNSKAKHAGLTTDQWLITHAIGGTLSDCTWLPHKPLRDCSEEEEMNSVLNIVSNQRWKIFRRVDQPNPCKKKS